MKVLVTYFSQSGNTEKIAKAIYEQATQDYKTELKKLEDITPDDVAEYKGCFDCQGFLAEAMHGPVQKKLNLDDDQWAGMVKQMTGCPNEEDVANAKAFAKTILA